VASLFAWLFCGLSLVGAVTASTEVPEEDIEALWSQVVMRGDGSRSASDSLQRLGGQAVPVLLVHLEDPYWKDRWDAVNLLGIIADQRATDPLIDRVLFDPNPHVRWRALWALSALRDPGVQDKFWAELQDREDTTARWNAVVGLAFFADTRSLPLLEQGLSREDSWQRWEAIYNLRRIHGDKTSGLLVPMLETESEERMRREVVMTLVHIGDAPATAALVGLLDDAAPEIRWRAVMGLSRNQAEGARELLETRRAAETDERVLEEIDKALAKLDSSP
jgi:HEAT repeat protein